MPQSFPLGRSSLLAGLVVVCVGSVPKPLAAQAAPPGELGRLKSAFLADYGELSRKFIALAEAFPADKYSWRPMPGVRSVGQVLGLIAAENYASLTRAFGGTPPADVPTGPDSEQKMEAITDKATLVKHIRESSSLAGKAITAWTGNPEGPMQFWGEKRTLAGLFITVLADQHEHLGQLIAYARANQIVPPWSK